MASDSPDKTEMKQQGAIEAAQAASRDPKSHISPETVEKKLVEDNRKAGFPAYQFDPDASPEEKAAEAEAVRFAPTVLLALGADDSLACACEFSPRAKTCSCRRRYR